MAPAMRRKRQWAAERGGREVCVCVGGGRGSRRIHMCVCVCVYEEKKKKKRTGEKKAFKAV
jgi:hypothetical protein